MSKTKVLLGYSGGVDSAVSGILLEQAGYEVISFTFNVDNEEFKKRVVEPFKSEYEKGRTPNPCVICNPEYKFRKLFEAAEEYGCDYVATGHYAQISEENGVFMVKKAVNIDKDQSYMLYRLPQEYLKRLIFPLGSIDSKNSVRDIARQQHLAVSEQKDSQDICFIPDGDYFSFLISAGAENRLGNFVGTDGEILGKHKGILNYTIGQRKGLGIALGKPAFVCGIDYDSGNIVVSTEQSDLYHNNVMVNRLCFAGLSVSEAMLKYEGTRAFVKLRYSRHEAPAAMHFEGDFLILSFDEAQRAPTPGQSAVLYVDDLVIGGGIIVK